MARVATVLCWVVVSGVAAAQDPVQDPQQDLRARVERLEKQHAEQIKALEQENEELRARQEILAGEVEEFQFRDVIPQVGEARPDLGLGPAGAKVYDVDQGLSIGGYGEFLFTKNNGKPNVADTQRIVTYFGYKFSDKFVFNSEIEIEHATTSASSGTTSGTGSVSAEFAYLDYLHSAPFNVRAGLVLVPMGLINEVHEPTTFLPALRPETERRILPATWRKLGGGIYGSAGGFDYRAYVVAGLDGEDFSAAGLRGGRQKGSRAAADDIAGVVRVDYVDVPGLMVGGSAYYGNSGQDNVDGAVSIPDLPTFIFETHADFRSGGWTLRGLLAMAFVGDAAEFNTNTGENLASRMQGWYLEGGYDVLTLLAPESSQALTPYMRYEVIDTQASMPTGFTPNAAGEDKIWTAGLNYKPIDQIVIKTDFALHSATSDEFHILLGYVF